MSETFSPLRWADDCLQLLDQTRLPVEETWLECRQPEQVAEAIRRLSVRGAPAIGVSAAYGLVVGLHGTPAARLRERFEEVYELLAGTRPTAVNLRWALDFGRRVFEQSLRRQASSQSGGDLSGGELTDSEAATVVAELLAWAKDVHREDVETNRRMGEHGAALFREGDRVLTHCNAGALATAGYGTAVGVIQSSWEHGRLGQVWVDETRPLLQGARLTAWELKKLGIPHRLVTDNSAGALMSRGLVDRIVVGADRIAANGDVANKIGTYVLAVLAQRHGVPFYVAAPLSTIDRDTPSGADIPIEQRDSGEVTAVFGTTIAPEDTEAVNFAFDVTPNELVTAIITEMGVLKPSYEESIRQAFTAKESGSRT